MENSSTRTWMEHLAIFVTPDIHFPSLLFRALIA
jgi:hypothetical protein